MRPANLKTKIFLDSGDPNETREAVNLLGFLDGQTTNPSLISKNPAIIAKLGSEVKFNQEELLKEYKNAVQQISSIIPTGSISIQVYSDSKTSAEQMLKMGKEMYEWIPSARIKYPTTFEGLKAAEESVKLGMRINMTLVCSQQQAAAIYSATYGAKKEQVVISPFIGRLDDKRESGMSLIENIVKMFDDSDHHIEILACSIRNMNHLLYCFKLQIDIVTLPFKTINDWCIQGNPLPQEDFVYTKGNLVDIPYQQYDLTKSWQQFNINHPLTKTGLGKFADDWNKLVR